MVHFMLEIGLVADFNSKQAINCFRNPGDTSKCCCSIWSHVCSSSVLGLSQLPREMSGSLVA